MQQTPVRLSQTIRITFQASRPVPRLPRSRFASSHQSRSQPWKSASPRVPGYLRFYTEGKKDTSRQVEAKNGNSSDEAKRPAGVRSEVPQPTQDTLVKSTANGLSNESPTISSTRTSSDASRTPPQPDHSADPTLPSETSSRRSPFSKRFTHLMDNLQSNVFTASRHLNDLTGYTGIERLKHSIEEQESLVQSSRSSIKELRKKYSAAVATRSATQREVNDLLHRKHNWSPQDLERFTNLYRSDHANEQAEAKAAAELSEAESQYEEAATRLGRTILARYHEEQIWSDKIRQMSTWGTWGLIGLNVLLFVVFQIAVEPWRRKRLVRGFEEKVEEALTAADGRRNGVTRAVTGPEVAAKVPDGHAQDVADTLAGAIVDAVTGTTDQDLENTSNVEAAIENITAHELASAQAEGAEIGKDDLLSFPNPVAGEPAGYTIPDSSSPSGFASYRETFRELFSERSVVVSQKELTAIALEGAVGGAALMGLILVLLRPR